MTSTRDQDDERQLPNRPENRSVDCCGCWPFCLTRAFGRATGSPASLELDAVTAPVTTDPAPSADARRPSRRVDVGPLLHLAVVVDGRGEVGDVHRDGRGELDLAAAPRIARTASVPSPCPGQQHLGEPHRLLHAHAAVTEGAQTAAEQMPLRRVVHVDVVLVGEAEFHHAQHVLGAGRLHEIVLMDGGGRPGDGVGIDGLAAAHDAQPMRLSTGLRHRRTGRRSRRRPCAAAAAARCLHAGRHAPGGMEDHEQHVGGEHRRRPSGLADHDPLGQHQLALL